MQTFWMRFCTENLGQLSPPITNCKVKPITQKLHSHTNTKTLREIEKKKLISSLTVVWCGHEKMLRMLFKSLVSGQYGKNFDKSLQQLMEHSSLSLSHKLSAYKLQVYTWVPRKIKEREREKERGRESTRKYKQKTKSS